jgi:hypothetical protein
MLLLPITMAVMGVSLLTVVAPLIYASAGVAGWRRHLRVGRHDGLDPR